jgi:hypothetical protein
MLDDREILTLSIKANDNIVEWLSEYQPLILSESISATEYMVYNNVDEARVVDIHVLPIIPHDTPYLMEVMVYLKDFKLNVNHIMDMVIRLEEYELAQRVKLLKERLNLN